MDSSTFSNGTIDQVSQEEYPYPSHVNAANFVYIRLSGRTNYKVWREQMMCLLESHDMLGFIDETSKKPKKKGRPTKEAVVKGKLWKRSDALIKGWIFGSLCEDVMCNVIDLSTANDVWIKLETIYSSLESAAPTTSENVSQKEYPYPSHVNAANFVYIKLSGRTNYEVWQEQMMCLLESHDMVGFIDGTLKKPKKKDFPKKEAADMVVIKGKQWKRSDALIKGWIFGSLCEDVMCIVIGLSTANDVWIKLETIYSSLESAAPTTSENDQAKHLPLYRAILKDDWKKAEDIFKMDKDALMFKLNDDEESPLHVAIGTCTNFDFVKKLLEKITSESLPTMVNTRKMNPLHHAAFVGNTRAAKMLVEKNPNMLFLPDGKNGKGYLPILRAIFGSHKETFSYLLDVTKKHIVLSKQANCQNPFEGNNGSTLFKTAIGAGLWDAAYELIKKYPKMATNISWGSTNTTTLEYIAGKLGEYLSEKPYNRYQRFVYSHVPLENHDVDKGLQHPDIENQDTHRVEFVSEQTKSCFHLVVQRIYDRFWNVALQHVPHIKQLHEEKVRDNKARVVLKCICEEVSKLNSICEIRKHYLKAITIAVEHDNLEAVEEIIGYFPQAISTKNNDYPLIQLAIMHRSERVYNFLVHRVTSNKHSQKVWTDENRNNLLHLAGMLAPIHKLNQVSGAALQMQRELQWFQEVKRIACPWHNKVKNNKQEKPIMTFRREHKELRKEGEDWMKKTADSYTITAALIITIVFAAAITVPGGTDGNNGKAIYVTRPSFIIFAVSDAISLFTSTTSLLLFLSILTARYAEKDFLYKLPKRLIFGLAMLFLSVTSMMVAFSATLYLMFGQGKAWILIPIATLTCLPIASFVTLQLPLLADLVSSTYGHGIFQKESDTRIK